MTNIKQKSNPPPEIEWPIPNLAGIHRGVQARISHVMVYLAPTFTLKDIVPTKNYSAQRLSVFQAEFKLDEDETPGGVIVLSCRLFK